MNRIATLGLAVALVLGPALPGLAQTTAPAAMSHDKMGSMSPESMTSHDGMTLGALPAALQGKPVVVRIHADWCPACKATAATFASVQHRYAGKARFFTFDVTDAKTAAAAQTRAAQLGLTKLYEADRTKTSTVAVLNPKTGAVATSLYNDNVASDYAKAIDGVASSLAKR